MIPLVEREVVTKYNLMDKHKFADIVSIAGGLPGAIGLNVAIFIGKTVAGLPGAIVGAIASVLPCLAIISSLMILFSNVSDNIYVKKALIGVSGVVVAFIVFATYKIALTAYKNPLYWILTIMTFFLSLTLPQVPLPIFIVGGMVIGIVIEWILKFFLVKKEKKHVI